MQDIYIMVPARIESSRFPSKPLAKINNKEMLVRVLDRCKGRFKLFAVVNSQILVELVESYGFESILIKDNCKLIDLKLNELTNKFPKLDANIIAIIRKDKKIIPRLKNGTNLPFQRAPSGT